MRLKVWFNMINLRKEFVDNLEKYDYYYYKFNNYLYDNEMNDYILFDISEIITEFKKLLYPYNNDSSIEDEMFIYLCFYLYINGYYIVEFPNFWERPTDRWDLSYNKIRSSIIATDGYYGRVAWEDRRIFVNNLTIKKNKSIYISEKIDIMIKNISTRNASFEEMAIDEKLKEICNCIEYLLKKNGNFDNIDYSFSCGYLTNEIVKQFRNKLECFRHATIESLKERENYTETQKLFLIDYGIVIISYIQSFYEKKISNSE